MGIPYLECPHASFVCPVSAAIGVPSCLRRGRRRRQGQGAVCRRLAVAHADQPELATALGDTRFNALLTDTSLSASLAANEHEKAVLEQAKAIDGAALNAANRLSLEMFIEQKERRLKAASFYPYRYAPLTNQAGLHRTLPRLAVQMPFTNEADYRIYLARLDAVPAQVDGLIEQMREAQRLGWSAPKISLRLLPAQLHQLRETLISGPLGLPLRELPATIPKAVRDEL